MATAGGEKMNRNVVGALVGAFVLVATGCGGSTPLSRAQLVRQANAICMRRTARIAAVQRSSKGNAKAFMSAALPVASRTLDELKALKPPTSMKGAYDRFIAGERAQVAQAESALVAFRANRRPAHGETVAQMHAQARVTQELGLEDCI
jgi:hypothetical protein